MSSKSIVFNDEYYSSLMKEFGYDPLSFSKIDFSLGSLSIDDLQRKWLCHSNGDIFAKKLQNGNKVIVSTGFGLSGVPHVGTLSQILRSIALQKAGVPVNMVLGDLDAYNGKALTLDFTRKLADKYMNFLLALGFDTSISIVLNQYDHPEVLHTGYLIGKYMTDAMFENAEEDLHDMYVQNQKVDHTMSYRRKLSLNLMVADFIHLPIAHGYESVLVMLGIDEHQYVRFAQETLTCILKDEDNGLGLEGFNISSIYSGLIKGFYEYPKMSKSFPDSGITADLSAEEIKRRIMEGEGSHDKPENSVVYQMMSAVSYFTPKELAERYEACLNGGVTWDNFKKEYAEILSDICSKWPHDK